jgi:hypothetical protein
MDGGVTHLLPAASACCWQSDGAVNRCQMGRCQSADRHGSAEQPLISALGIINDRFDRPLTGGGKRTLDTVSYLMTGQLTYCYHPTVPVVSEGQHVPRSDLFLALQQYNHLTAPVFRSEISLT